MRVLLALMVGVAAFGQENLVSPEVHADGKVTFRLYAPKAAEVMIAGEWTRPNSTPNTPEKMTKGSDGIWSTTLGPIEPNIYIYTYRVDGMTITDPVNPYVKLRSRTSASMVSVPGNMPWEFRDVPHGSVDVNWHKSALLNGEMRQIFVYTPPDYDKNRSQRYPVLYLLHGSNDLAAGWTMAGNANLIFDNLLAEKKAVPMVVVMPYGHALPFGTRPAPGQKSNNDIFEEYLLKEVMPFAEGKYRIAATRNSRAIMGLSMGGGQALQIMLGHPDLFSALGVFGAGVNRAEFEQKYKDALTELAKPAKRPPIVFIGMAKQDNVPRAKQLSESLSAHGIKNIFHETEGGHTYPVWRKLLVESAPLLFQKGAKPSSD